MRWFDLVFAALLTAIVILLGVALVLPPNRTPPPGDPVWFTDDNGPFFSPGKYPP